jgi:hypothetical protein
MHTDQTKAAALQAERCDKCGWLLPAEADELDHLLADQETAECPGHPAVDRNGTPLGCGAWLPAAYED